MPGLSGLDLLKSLREPPMAIITTAYREYAVESFEPEVVDYLHKPFSFDRFFKAIQRAEEKLDTKMLMWTNEKNHLRKPKSICLLNQTKSTTKFFMMIRCLLRLWVIIANLPQKQSGIPIGYSYGKDFIKYIDD